MYSNAPMRLAEPPGVSTVTSAGPAGLAGVVAPDFLPDFPSVGSSPGSEYDDQSEFCDLNGFDPAGGSTACIDVASQLATIFGVQRVRLKKLGYLGYLGYLDYFGDVDVDAD